MSKLKSKLKVENGTALRHDRSPQTKNKALERGKKKPQHHRLDGTSKPADHTSDAFIPEESDNSEGRESLDDGDSSRQGQDDDEEDDGDDVSEGGMERLMTALGSDGLDEFAEAQLSKMGVDQDMGESEEQEQDGSEDDEASSGIGSDVNSSVEGEAENDASDVGQGVPFDEIVSDGEVDEDVVPRQKVTINNELALKRIRETIQLDPSLPWTETLAVTSTEPLDDVDPDDDLQRELAFYKQALYCAQTAQALALKHKLPFTRPSDYYAEMVKSDAHMERIRMRLLDETDNIKKSEQAKQQRDLKKFGKQVQVEKLKERAKEKKVMEERVKGLKRKRKGGLDDPKTADEDFDIAVEDAMGDRPAKKGRVGAMPRSKRDAKFHVGGGGRHSKQNTRESSNNFEFSRGKGRGGLSKSGGQRGKGAKRLGKSRRQSAKR